MAEFLVRPLLSTVQNASSYLAGQYRVMEGMEEQRKALERMLPLILTVIHDAQNRTKQSQVGAWLQELKKVSYEATDVFDEFRYEALRREARRKGHGAVSLFSSRNPIVFRYRMGKKLRKIVQRIKELVEEMNSFGLVHRQETPRQSRQTDSVMLDFEKDIVSRSRDEEKRKVVKILVDEASDRELTVLPVVGMGGLGKTTFAQLIYNDPEILKHFQLRRWCCVSDEFDVVSIANNICVSTERNRERALQDLQKEVSGKKFLIVLDDVWNRDSDKWGKLMTCLKQGSRGSVVLTTTRDVKVATIMATSEVEVYNLGKLGEVYLKEIIQSKAIGLPGSDEHLEVLNKIVQRCDGSPLAAKSFGSVLSSRSTVQEWKDILAKSNICNEGEDTIFPILRLSYDDLPFDMKQCFAFCAIFPKDYVIDVETLIKLWLAHDFIPLQEDDNLESAAEDIFKELVWRSFFQDVKKSSIWTTCKIHDLMHDIAQSVMGKECVSIAGRSNFISLLSEHPRYHFHSSYKETVLLDDFMRKQSPTLRSLLFERWFNYFSTSHLSKCSSLRALKLLRCSEFLPIGHLQHLRYLNISSNSCIKKLPKDICILYNLQTLVLSYCKNLVELPKDMKYMKNLRHLYTDGCPKLKYMPPDLGQLTSLQILTSFVVGARSGCSNLRELRTLNLCGRLQLCGLENEKEENAKAANLRNKEKLTHLSLEWNSNCHLEGTNSPYKVLDALKPHHRLQMLKVISYTGSSFPAWITDLGVLQNLIELHLEGCTMCGEFPQFIRFKFLQVLYLSRLDNLQTLCREEGRQGTEQAFHQLEKVVINICPKFQTLCSGVASTAFPELKEVKLMDLESFETWVAMEGRQGYMPTFPLLEEVEINKCPKLTTLPEAPKLKILNLNENKAQLSLSLLQSSYISSLSKLRLEIDDKETTLQLLDQIHESSLSEMELTHCNILFPLSPSQSKMRIWEWLGQLVELKIDSCDSLIYWPEEEFLCLVSLKKLTIKECYNLIGRPTQVTGNPTLLPHLTSLYVSKCVRLRELFVLPPSIKYITINDSICLESFSFPSYHLPCLERLSFWNCRSVVTLQNLPPCLMLSIDACWELQSLSGQLDELKHLGIVRCNKLESLNCLGELPSLEHLDLKMCKRLASAPCGPRSYSSLLSITIQDCPRMNMKKVYEWLRPRLDSLEERDLSHAHTRVIYEESKCPTLKSWKYAITRRW
ncbi:putative disease resistance protein RGA4 [Oryza brachyantha]|uniref:NB-ARC domain-containing protein n=1 Tax=Oryza brachyantha TaxID=4533 RepID=J3N0Q5_ORYBR|nr:putative disease resistance protein RGA4 [Oryza brachyantha]XP_040384072.1 putative disease resistance protein RGA4 [Oryza brachyantha]